MESGGEGGEAEVQSEPKIRVCCTLKEIAKRVGPQAVQQMRENGSLRYVGKNHQGEQLWEYEYSDPCRAERVVWADQ